MMETLIDLLTPPSGDVDTVALIEEDIRMTYRELKEHVSHLGRYLQCKFNPGTRIGIAAPNSIWTVVSLFAASYAGLIIVPIDFGSHPKTLENLVTTCQMEALITVPAVHARLAPLLRNHCEFILLSESGDLLTIQNAIFLGKINKDNPRPASPKDIAVIMHTTGTTGKKKGVVLSHSNLLQASRNIIEFMDISMPIIESVPMPLSHSFGFARLRVVLELGGTVIIENGLLHPERILSNILKNGANALSMVPSGFSIIQSRASDLFRQCAQQIRYVELGSAPMGASEKRELASQFPFATVCMHYGLTEASRSTFLNLKDEPRHLHTVGRPSPNVSIKILDETGTNVIDKPGSIWVSGPHVMEGYFENDALTHATLIDGWFNTGDQGMINQEGYIIFLGREDDILNLSGLKVAPTEIEIVVNQLPNIKESCAVLTAPTVITIAVVLEDPTAPVELIDLQKWCMRSLESYKIPREVRILSVLPKTHNGKLQRKQVLDALSPS